MTLKEVRDLHPGDEVFWTDPDAGACSRYYTIQSIEVSNDMSLGDLTTIRIVDVAGDVLECFAGELS